MFLRNWLVILYCVCVSAFAGQPQVVCRFPANHFFGTFVEGRDGAFYGCGGDKVFRVTPGGDYRVIYDFDLGQVPNLVAADDGHLYGSAQFNRSSTLFRMSYSGRLEPLYEFPLDAGGNPIVAHQLLMGPDGALYGIAFSGDPARHSVFRATLDGMVTTVADLSNMNLRYVHGLRVGHDGAFRAIAEVMEAYPTVIRIGLDGTVSDAVAQRLSPIIDLGNLWAHPDGNYYLSGYSSEMYRLTPSGEFTRIVAPGVGSFLARDGLFYRSEYGDTGRVQIGRMHPDGRYEVLVTNIAPILSPGFLLQNHRGVFFGISDRGSWQGLTRWATSGQPAANLGPYACPDFAQPPAAGMTRKISVLRNDRDVNDDQITITAVGAPRFGTASLAPNGRDILYTAPTGEQVDTDAFTYTVSDGKGGLGIGRVSLRANVRGKFAALIQNSDWRADGHIHVHLSSYGGLSGHLWLGGFMWRFSGILDEDNRFSATLRNEAFQTAEIAVQLESSRLASSVVAAVRVNDVTLEQVLTRPNLEQAAASASSYTFIIPPERSWRDLRPIESPVHQMIIEHPLQQAQGYGFGHCRVLPNGAAMLKGKMPDGAPFTATNWLDAVGRLQVFGTLYPYDWTHSSMRGWVRGLVTFRDTPGVSDGDGQLKWAITVPGIGYAMPPIAEEVVAFRASRYVPAELDDFVSSPRRAFADGGGIAQAESGLVSFLGDQLSAGAPFRVNGHLSRPTGQLSGHITRASRWTPWSGVLFQKQRAIFGRFQDFKLRDYWQPFPGSGLFKIGPE